MKLIRLFLEICLFKKGPQDVPRSELLLGLAVTASILLGAVLALMEPDWITDILRTLLGTALMAALFWVALRVVRMPQRFVQTATAGFGCDALVTLIAAPLLVFGQWVPDLRGEVGALLLLAMLWQVAVLGHILRHALSVGFASGLMLAFGYTAAAVQLVTAFFPVAVPT
jgi:hypothetical protein